MKGAQPKNSQAEADFVPEFPGQHPSESVLLVFRQHPVIMRRPLIYGMLVILVGIIPLMIWPLSSIAIWIAIAGPVIAAFYWFYMWMGWYYSVFILTDQRLIDIQQKGLFNRKVSEVGLNRIQSINYHIKGFQAALFKFGTITIQTYVGDWVMESIEHPVDVHSQLMAATREVADPGSTPTDD